MKKLKEIYSLKFKLLKFTMTKQNLIHIKINSNELISNKKEILSLELELIKTLRTMKLYKELRLKEMELKFIFLRKLNMTKNLIKRLEKTLPVSEFPEEIKQKNEKVEIKKPLNKRDNLEIQLEEIRTKLMELENK